MVKRKHGHPVFVRRSTRNSVEPPDYKGNVRNPDLSRLKRGIPYAHGDFDTSPAEDCKGIPPTEYERDELEKKGEEYYTKYLWGGLNWSYHNGKGLDSYSYIAPKFTKSTATEGVTKFSSYTAIALQVQSDGGDPMKMVNRYKQAVGIPVEEPNETQGNNASPANDDNETGTDDSDEDTVAADDLIIHAAGQEDEEDLIASGDNNETVTDDSDEDTVAADDLIIHAAGQEDEEDLIASGDNNEAVALDLDEATDSVDLDENTAGQNGEEENRQARRVTITPAWQGGTIRSSDGTGVNTDDHTSTNNNDQAPQDPPTEATDEEGVIVEAITTWLQGKLPHVLAKTREAYAQSMFDYGFESVEALENELLEHQETHKVLESDIKMKVGHRRSLLRAIENGR